MYLWLKFLQSIFENIPRKAGYFIFEFFFLCNLFLPSKRKNNLKKNLTHVLGRKAPDSMVRDVYKCYARYYFDLYHDKEKILSSVTVTPGFQSSFDISKKLLEKNTGLIILSLHMGSWDFAASYIARMYPGKTHVVVEKLSPGVFKWFTETRQKTGIKVIDSADIKSMIRALRNKDVLIMVTDRDLDKKGYELDLFGKKAHIPSGPAKLALACGVPMMMGAMTRDKNNPLKFLPFFDPQVLNSPALEKTGENALKLTQEIIILMEKHLSEYPEQWCLLQQVWLEDKSKVKNQNKNNKNTMLLH